MLDPYEDRSATAQICFVLYDEDGPHIFSASRAGTISATPLGLQEFGWNPIFIPAGETKTWAEMSLEEQKATSMRRMAIEKVQAYLEAHYA
jgi:inosine/xanthosine triphosphate pyrophosphatase family protein